MTYEIKTENGKQNIYYTGGLFDGLKEFYPGDPTKIRSGYINITSPKWSAMYEALLGNDALILKMLSIASMSGHLASIYAILQRGVDGFPNESRLSYLVNRPGWNWSNGEKTQINNYFIAHNFSISIT